MRALALLVLALATATTFSSASAQTAGSMGGSGGPVRNGNMCRSFNGSSNNIFSYWDSCPGDPARRHAAPRRRHDQ